MNALYMDSTRRNSGTKSAVGLEVGGHGELRELLQHSYTVLFDV